MGNSKSHDDEGSQQEQDPQKGDGEKKKSKDWSKGWEFSIFFMELTLLILYCTCTTYKDGESISYATDEEQWALDNAQATKTMQEVFPMWTDINVMVFVGFGFLIVFLKTNSLTAISFNMLAGAFAMQWGILCYAFWKMILVGDNWEKLAIDI